MTIASKGSLGVASNTANNQASTSHTTGTTVADGGDLVIIIMA